MCLQVYNDGLRNMNLVFILNKLALPAVCLLGMILAVPYVFATSIVPLLGKKLVQLSPPFNFMLVSHGH